MASAAGCISAQWKGAETGSSMARLAPFALAISTARSTAALSPGHDHLAAAIVVRRLADLALRGLRGDRRGRVEVEPEQRRHGAGADRHRLLHGAAADAQKPRGVGNATALPAAASAEYSPSEWPATKAASRARSRPASASSTRNAASDTAISAGCAFSVSVSVSAGPSHIDRRELLAERVVDLVEHLPRRRKSLGQALAHADRLAALAGKYESRRHPLPLKEGRKIPRSRRCQGRRPR